MKHPMLLVLAMAAALGVASGHADAASARFAARPAKLESRWHIDANNRFRIALPNTWRAYKSQRSVALLAISPQDAPNDPMRERLSLAVSMFDEPVSAEEFAAHLIDEAKGSLTGFKLHESAFTTLNGRIFYKLVYGYQHDHNELRNMAYLHIEGYRAYAILYAASPASLKKYQPLFDAITGSFKAIP